MLRNRKIKNKQHENMEKNVISKKSIFKRFSILHSKSKRDYAKNSERVKERKNQQSGLEFKLQKTK